MANKLRKKKRAGARNQAARSRYPELHGKTVDFVHHWVEDGVLYFGIKFTDRTAFSIRYRCEMSVIGAELTQITKGDVEVIRQYRPGARKT